MSGNLGLILKPVPIRSLETNDPASVPFLSYRTMFASPSGEIPNCARKFPFSSANAIPNEPGLFFASCGLNARFARSSPCRSLIRSTVVPPFSTASLSPPSPSPFLNSAKDVPPAFIPKATRSVSSSSSNNESPTDFSGPGVNTARTLPSSSTSSKRFALATSSVIDYPPSLMVCLACSLDSFWCETGRFCRIPMPKRVPQNRSNHHDNR